MEKERRARCETDHASDDGAAGKGQPMTVKARIDNLLACVGLMRTDIHQSRMQARAEHMAFENRTDRQLAAQRQEKAVEEAGRIKDEILSQWGSLQVRRTPMKGYVVIQYQVAEELMLMYQGNDQDRIVVLEQAVGKYIERELRRTRFFNVGYR